MSMPAPVRGGWRVYRRAGSEISIKECVLINRGMKMKRVLRMKGL